MTSLCFHDIEKCYWLSDWLTHWPSPAISRVALVTKGKFSILPYKPWIPIQIHTKIGVFKIKYSFVIIALNGLLWVKNPLQYSGFNIYSNDSPYRGQVEANIRQSEIKQKTVLSFHRLVFLFPLKEICQEVHFILIT